MGVVREAIEGLYKDSCNIIERQSVKDPVTKKTCFIEIMAYSNMPCRLSFGSVPSTTDGNTAEMIQSVKLFISPDLAIKPGSKIVVTQPGKAAVDYSNSSKPAIHTNHQEVELKLFERWS